jgi:hypothetical protein
MLLRGAWPFSFMATRPPALRVTSDLLDLSSGQKPAVSPFPEIKNLLVG